MPVGKNRGTKRYVKEMRQREVSTVRLGAQRNANIDAIKRSSEDGEDENKGGLVDMFTSTVDGHQHGIDLDIYDSKLYPWVGYAASSNGTHHSHDLYYDDDGNLKLTENAGHTHEIDMEAFSQKIVAMTTDKGLELPAVDPNTGLPIGKTQTGNPKGKPKMKDETKTGDVQEENKGNEALESLTATVEKQGKIIAMPAETRKYYDLLESEEAKDAFLGKSADEQKAAIEKAAAAAEAEKTADDVAYKSPHTGVEYLKSDDPRMVIQAKAQDAQMDKMLEAEEKAKKAETKAVVDGALSHLAGEEADKTALAEALSTISDEKTRDNVIKMLGTGKGSKLATTQISDKSAPDVEGDEDGEELTEDKAVEKLEEKAAEYAKAHPDLKTDGWDEVCADPKNKALVTKALGNAKPATGKDD